MSLIISVLLHEYTFSAALLSTGLFVLLKQRHLHASLAILFFIGGWYATEIPLLSELTITTPQKYVAQAIVSLCLIALYSSLSGSLPLLIASINELLLIMINIVFLMGDFRPWPHWFLFGVINWISLVVLIVNWRVTDAGCKRPGEQSRSFKALDHIYGVSSIINKKNQAMDEAKT